MSPELQNNVLMLAALPPASLTICELRAQGDAHLQAFTALYKQEQVRKEAAAKRLRDHLSTVDVVGPESYRSTDAAEKYKPAEVREAEW